MSTVTDNDLKELKDLINSKFEQVDRKFEKVFEELTDIKVDIATLKTDVNAVNKRLDSVDNRLNTITLGVFGTIGVLVTGLLTFIGKVVFFPNP
jgi:tetrahydromethanopterin S-methyltransferase subunit G